MTQAMSMPTHGQARTRTGLYATLEHAQDIDALMNGDVLWIALDCCARNAVEQALGTTHGLMAARDLPADTPVFVDGDVPDPTGAAKLVDRLNDAGLTRVFLITD